MADVAARATLTDVHIVYPEAAGASWYPGRFNDPIPDNEPSLTHALEPVDDALAVLAADGVPAEQTVLVGSRKARACSPSISCGGLVRTPPSLLTGCKSDRTAGLATWTAHWTGFRC